MGSPSLSKDKEADYQPRIVVVAAFASTAHTINWLLSVAARRKKTMLWAIMIILFVLWLLGVLLSYTASGLIHILLVLAVVALVVQLLTGRRTVV